MSSSPVFLAIDLGASNGRVIAAGIDSGRMDFDEVHRFATLGVDLPDGSYWNLLGLYHEILEGLRLAAQRYGSRIVSIGIDSWGCDFALLDGNGQLLGLPHQYRDSRHDGIAPVMHELISEVEIFAHTGVRTNFYNTSLHLLAERRKSSPALHQAERLLFIPDLIAYWLTGKAVVERTVASTSQLLDPRRGDWAWGVIESLGLPSKLFGEVVAPGTVLGPLRAEVARSIGAEGISVIASATHDTASAVAGIPMEGDDTLWLSSGTWSIMGLQRREPLTGVAAYRSGFSNELGVGDTVRFLKNIAGLWLIQECKRHWTLAGERLEFAELAAMAKEAGPFSAFIDPDDPVFASPGDMPEKIQSWCERTGQKVPRTKGAILRIAVESLALKYRVVCDDLQTLTGLTFDRLHIGGGGAQDGFLNQATANALSIPVIAGPVEATSCGNLTTQMVATGHLPDLQAGRRLIRNSFEFATFAPRDTELWNEAYTRFRPLCQRKAVASSL